MIVLILILAGPDPGLGSPLPPFNRAPCLGNLTTGYQEDIKESFNLDMRRAEALPAGIVVCSILKFPHKCPISGSEQALGSGFHPSDKSDKINCGFLGPSWHDKR